MKKYPIIFLLSILQLFCSASPSTSPELTGSSNLTVISLEGTPYERGVQHGTQLESEIKSLILQWKDYLRNSFLIMPDSLIQRFARETNYVPAIRLHTPALWDELRGIADGAGVDFTTLYVYQLVDEIWALGHKFLNHSCTTFGVNAASPLPTVTGQNLDIPFFHGYQLLLKIKDTDTGIESFVLSYPGLIGTTGMNNQPISVNVNTVLQLKPSTDGLPVAFVVRGILEKQSFDEAKQFLKSIKHGAAQNYLIGGIEEMASFECSENTAVEYLPFDNARYTYHTNHPMANFNLTDQLMNDLVLAGKSPDQYQYSCPRFDYLKTNFYTNNIPVDINILKNLFSSRISYINNSSTFATVIMELSNTPALHIAPGRPDIEPFQVFRF